MTTKVPADFSGQWSKGEHGIFETICCSEVSEMYRQFRPDVAPTDITMEETGRIEATRPIRAFDPKLKVIVVTMFDVRRKWLKSFEAGASGCLPEED